MTVMSTAEAGLSKVPRRVAEAFLVVGAALGVVWLFNRNIYFGLSAVVTMFSGIILLTNPIALIYISFAFIPIHWINLLGRRFRVLTFLTLMSLLFFGLRAVARKLPIPKEPVLFAYLLYLGACALSLVNTISFAASFYATKYFILSLLFGLVLVFSIETKKQLKTLFWILLMWGIALSILSVLQSAVSIKFYPAYHFRVFGIKIVEQYSVHGINRASGTFESGPRYAMFLLGPIAMVVASFMRNLQKKRLLWVSMLIVFLVGLMVSFTRAAILLAVGYLFIYNIIERDWSRFVKSIGWAVILAVVVLAVILLFIPDQVTDAMLARFQTEDDEQYMDRLTFLYVAVRAWMENPIIGLGVGTFAGHSWDLMQRYPIPWRSLSWDMNPLAMPMDVTVHNDYGRMLAETGIFSLLAIFLIYFFSFRNFFFVMRHSRDEFLSTFAVAMAMYLTAMIPYWFFHEYIMAEPYTSMLPMVVSILLKRLTLREVEARPKEPQPALPQTAKT